MRDPNPTTAIADMPAPTGVVSSQFVRLGFEAKGIQATINLPDCALSALIALIKVKDSPNIWAVLEMACEWKFADADEQENIRRTISELLESNAPDQVSGASNQKPK